MRRNAMLYNYCFAVSERKQSGTNWTKDETRENQEEMKKTEWEDSA